MKYLFEVAPDEGQRKRTSKRPAAAPAPVDEGDVVASKYAPPSPRPEAVIGTIDDDTYVCPHPRCGAGAQDILLESGKEWLIACAFCGSMQWVKAIAGHLEPKPEEFRFRDGRFAGMTPAEAAREPRGPDYLAWAAENHPRPAVRDAVKNHLDGLGKGL
jgi:hypothetical protein